MRDVSMNATRWRRATLDVHKVDTRIKLWCHSEVKAKLKAVVEVQQSPQSSFISCVTQTQAKPEESDAFHSRHESVADHLSLHYDFCRTFSPLKGTGLSTVGFSDQSIRQSQTASRKILHPWRRSSCSWRRNSRPGRQKNPKNWGFQQGPTSTLHFLLPGFERPTSGW